MNGGTHEHHAVFYPVLEEATTHHTLWSAGFRLWCLGLGMLFYIKAI